MNRITYENGDSAWDNGPAAMRRFGPLAQRNLLLVETVDLLVEKAEAQEACPEVYEQAARVLECLPVTTADFALATRRLCNAVEYARQGEFGAAAFELRMVRNQLVVANL